MLSASSAMALFAALAVPGITPLAAEASASAADEETLAEVVVTGSRIARRDYVAQSPIVTATAEALSQSGAATLDNFLRQLPQFQPGTGEFSNNSAGGTIGQSNLNLRGLGAQRNLVLLEGRRLQTSDNTGAIDINTIPSMAVGNIEVITGGASATYGSDAMSGVVNFRLRTDLKGLELSAQHSGTTDGDGHVDQFGVAWGGDYAQGRGKALLSAEYVERDGVAVRDRPFFLDTAASGFLPQGNVNPDGTNLPSQAAVNAIFARYGITTGVPARTGNFFLNNDGSLFSRGTSLTNTVNYRGPTTLPFIANSRFFGYHGSYFNFLRAPLERSALFGRTEFALTDSITGYAQANYSHGKVRNIGSEAILAAGFLENIPVTNPFIPADLAQLIASRTRPTAEFQYIDRVEQVGPRVYQTTTNLWQGMVGLKGSIADTGLNWDVYYSRGDTTTRDATISGAVSVAAINRLTRAADGGATLCAGGYNPFGLKDLSAACVAYISRTPENKTSITQDVLEATLDGALFSLPAGQAKFALTGTYRSTDYGFRPDADIAIGDIATIASTQATNGKVDVKELSAEVLLPVLAGVPMVESLNVTLGYRLSDYNLSGTANTWKADFDWRVFKPLLLRGGYQKALRAPNIGEFFQAPTQIIVGVGNPPGSGDPCDTRSSLRTGATAAAVRTLCIANGIPATLVDSYRITTASIITTFQGNTALEPESAKTWTLGAVLTSPFETDALRNLSLSADFFNIKIDNAIATLAPLTVLQKCFNADGSNPTYAANNFFCQKVTRPTGNDPFVSRPTLNLGGYRTKGMDLQLSWRVPVELINGSVSLDSYASKLKSFAIQTLPGTAFQENVATLSGSTSYPRWTLVNSAAVDIGRFQLSARWRHINPMRDSSRVTNPASTTPGVDAYNYIDLSARAEITDKIEARFGVNNFTDKAPPVVAGTPGATNLGVYDAIGRTIFVSAKARF
ncbi:MAG: hypothetical protein RLZ98_2689 [Pseudomonadota bacterium]|jgi:outer membrane receptor protein involved in Fe transport